jgi:hypothetical protein
VLRRGWLSLLVRTLNLDAGRCVVAFDDCSPS